MSGAIEFYEPKVLPGRLLGDTQVETFTVDVFVDGDTEGQISPTPQVAVVASGRKVHSLTVGDGLTVVDQNTIRVTLDASAFSAWPQVKLYYSVLEPSRVDFCQFVQLVKTYLR